MKAAFRSYFTPERDTTPPEPRARPLSRQRTHEQQPTIVKSSREGTNISRRPPIPLFNEDKASPDLDGQVASNDPFVRAQPQYLMDSSEASRMPSCPRPGSIRESSGPSSICRGRSKSPLATNSMGSLLDVKNDMMVKWLYEQQLRSQFTTGWDPTGGVVLKKSRGNFTSCPPQLQAIPDGLFAMVVRMNVRVAMSVDTLTINTIMDNIAETGADFVPLPDGLRVQILPTISDLPKGQLHHFAAFIKDSRILVVWDDEPENILHRAATLEGRFMEMIWGAGNHPVDDSPDEENISEQNLEKLDQRELEEALSREYRPVRLESACLVACTLFLCIVCLGLGWRNLAIQIMIDGDWRRLGLLAVAPPQVFVSLFFFQTLISNLFQIFGPVSAVSSNSKYYSGKPPRRLARTERSFPHVTIQMPVYKEGLNAVIKPTVMSLKTAISTYEMQGGTANIFINDDGMQLIPEDEAQARKDFYDEHNIGWVARPKHNPKGENGEKAFQRRGKFKKASNMNYALHVSNRVEEKLQQVNRTPYWTQENEWNSYCKSLSDVLQEDEGRTWAEGNIRVGDYILLIDSDTRVPNDCLLDAVSEMEQSPNVAIIQYSSGVMKVADSYFENGVTWFTNLIYTAITFAVASGDVCPFVGHNAVLRWRAIQDASAYTDEDGYEKFWSESHVSEDFDMSLRLQVAGYALRYAAYTGDGFKEGVSLTVYDELARWEKYAYGCNELLFHPFRFWIVRGPFTRLFKDFLFSSLQLPKKLTIIAYIGTYYAIAAAWTLPLSNYFITGWFSDMVDKYYLDSFAIYIAIIVVFTGLGNLSLAVLRYRINERSLLGSLLENFKWIPMFTVFLGGISIHVSQAILSHFFEIDMVWGATAKEVEQVNFSEEIGRILKRFKWTFAYCIACSALMICAYFAFPTQWQIKTFYSIYPLASVVFSHFTLPVLLNPALMMFTCGLPIRAVTV